MPSKISPVVVRVQPETKEALERAAKADMRSMSSLIEKVLVEWLRAQEAKTLKRVRK